MFGGTGQCLLTPASFPNERSRPTAGAFFGEPDCYNRNVDMDPISDAGGAPERAVPTRLAVVIPMRDEAQNIGPVLESLTGALRRAPLSGLEAVLVDDASNDGSARAARESWARLSFGGLPARLHVVRLAENVGHQRALAAGFRRARGLGVDLIFAMDADGQDDPSVLPEMIARLSNCDVVFAERGARAESLPWRAGYGIYRVFLRAVLGADLPYGNFCGFRAEKLGPLLDGRPFRHLAAELSRLPARKDRVTAARLPRLAGKPKMGLGALIDHGVAALTSRPDAWVRLFSRVALLTAAAALGGGATVVGIRLFTRLAIPGWASTTTLILGLIAFQAVGFLALSAFLAAILEAVSPAPAPREQGTDVDQGRP